MRIGCYIIARKDHDKIRACIKDQMGLADVVVVAVDDNSDSDRTYEEVVATVGDPELEVYGYRQPNLTSFADSRNDALYTLLRTFSDLNYTYWVDSDDIWEDNIDFVAFRERLSSECPLSVSLPYQYTNNMELSRNRFWAVSNGESVYRWKGVAHETEEKVITNLPFEDAKWDSPKLVHITDNNPEDHVRKRARNVALLEDAYQKDPSDHRSLFYLAREYSNSGDYLRAIGHFTYFLEVNHDVLHCYQAKLDLIDIYLGDNEYRNLIAAERTAQDAIALCPNIAVAACKLGDVYRIQEKWALALVWYEYAINAPGGPMLFDMINLRTVYPLRWASVMACKVNRMDKAKEYHKRAGECGVDDGLQTANDMWLFSNDYIPNYLEDHFKATAENVDPNEYMIIENFNNDNTKQDIKAMGDYNKGMQIVRILNEGTPEAAAVIFKGHNDYEFTVPPEEKHRLKICSYKELFHPTQLSLYEDFYKEIAMKFVPTFYTNSGFNIVELGSDQGLSARLFLDLYKENKNVSLTFIDTNLTKELWAVLDEGHSKFIQDTAENAAKTFADGSIDLLHMDLAPHTYEQAARIFALYLPKMAKGGVWIWHDVGRSRDFAFGGRKFLDELRYPWVVCYCPETNELPDVAPAAIWRVDER